MTTHTAIPARTPGKPVRNPIAELGELHNPAWMARAECARRRHSDRKPFYDPNLWTPYGDGGRRYTNVEDDAEAIRICRRCPVIDACLHWAIDNDEPGILGGTTDGQRGRMRAEEAV